MRDRWSAILSVLEESTFHLEHAGPTHESAPRHYLRIDEVSLRESCGSCSAIRATLDGGSSALGQRQQNIRVPSAVEAERLVLLEVAADVEPRRMDAEQRPGQIALPPNLP